MARDEQFENPYAPPASRVEPPQQDQDELHNSLERAFFAATYGTFFFPGLGLLIAIWLLIMARQRRDEFSPIHQRLFNETALICRIVLILMVVAAVLLAGESTFQWSRHLPFKL